MALNKIMACATLGAGLKDKLILGWFGFLMPRVHKAKKRWWRTLASRIPPMWLRPAKLNGLQLLVHPTNWSQTLIFEEIFLQSAYDLRQVKFEPEVVLDCGAHIGIFSLLTRSAFPQARLMAFEPNPQNIQQLKQLIAFNRLDMKLIESAISTEAGEMFFRASNSHSGRLLQTDGDGAYKVQTIDFSETLKQIRPASLLLKMDIEGGEREVLPAIMPLLPRRTALFFETHFGEPGWREIETLLISSGFKVDQINARGQFYDGFAIRD